MKRIIINGANGYLASNFIAELLTRDYEVVALVRGQKDCSAEQRMRQALIKYCDVALSKKSKLKVYDYALLEPDFGMDKAFVESLFNGETDYYHFAASLKYNEKSKDEIFTTNIDGVANSADVFKRYHHPSSRFFLISTAYSCGHMDTPFEERFYDNQPIDAFRNYYENSKRYAENVIKEKLVDNNIKAHVIRPSQVIGNLSKGVTRTDFGVFDFTKRISSVAFRYPKGDLRVQVDPDTTQNLIPIDTIVSYFMLTVESKDLPTVMNFVARKAITNRHISKCMNEVLPVDIILEKNLPKEKQTALERIISVGMSFTGEYVGVQLKFSTQNLDKITKGMGQDIDKESFRKMLQQFILSLHTSKNEHVEQVNEKKNII